MEGLTVIGFFIFIATMIFMSSRTGRETTVRIQQYVEVRGGRDVKVTSTHDGGRDNWGFRVTYKDRHDITRVRRCKVSATVFANEEPIFWLDDLQIAGKETAVTLPTPPSSTKEQIISNLSAENEQLRTEMAELRQQQRV